MHWVSSCLGIDESVCSKLDRQDLKYQMKVCDFVNEVHRIEVVKLTNISLKEKVHCVY